jgi:hypothetical protein
MKLAKRFEARGGPAIRDKRNLRLTVEFHRQTALAR